MTDQSASAVSGDQEGIQKLLFRLKSQSLQLDFQFQRETAMSLVLKPYLDPITAQYLAPLPEEIEIAEGYLYADYLPTDGHPSLVEQVRDTITEHVPEEERIWLDPVRHSYMDLLQVVELDQEKQPPHLLLQSLGDQQQFDVPYSEKTVVQKDHVLLTRLIRGSSGTYLPAPPSFYHRPWRKPCWRSLMIYAGESNLAREILRWPNGPNSLNNMAIC